MAKTPGNYSRSEWSDALSAALSIPSGSAVERSLFHESRHDLAIEVVTDGDAHTVHTHTGGLCFEDPAADAQLAYVSSVDPADASRLVRGSYVTNGDLPARAINLEPPPDDAARAVAEELLSRAKRIDGIAQVAVRWVSSVQRVEIARADGFVATDERSGYRIRIDGYAGRSERPVRATVELAERPAPNPGDPRLVRLVDELAFTLARRRDPMPPPSGETVVVLAPGLGGIWAHEIFGHALEADAVAADRSWTGDLAPDALPEELTVSDDPRRCRTPMLVDDQGTPTASTRLVAHGRVVSCLHDRATAARAGRSSTGHGRRATFRDPVLPRMTCTLVEPGTTAPDDILESVDDGIYVRRMEAGSADIASGRATFRVVDSERIFHGRLVGTVEPYVLEIEARRGFRGMLIGNDPAIDTCVGSCHRSGQTLITSVGAPTLCLGMVGVVR